MNEAKTCTVELTESQYMLIMALLTIARDCGDLYEHLAAYRHILTEGINESD